MFHAYLWLVMWSETVAALMLTGQGWHDLGLRKWSKLNLSALNVPQANRNLRRWIAPLSTMRRRFFNPSYKRILYNSLNFYLHFRLQFPLDFGLIFRYYVGCKNHTNAENRRERMTNMKKLNTSVLMVAILATVLAIPATATVAPPNPSG